MSKQVSWLATLVALIAYGVRADAADENNKVHFLLVGDTKDNRIGTGIGNNLDVFRVLHASLDMEEGDKRGKLVVIDGTKAKAKDVLAAAEAMPTNDENDALVCYVTCHGAYDEKRGGADATNGHFFALPGGDLMRADLWKALRPEKRRLTVLITDTCNSPGEANPVAGTVPDRLPPGFENMDKPKWKLARALFVRASGVVDVSGSSKNEFGWFQGPLPGGWFTYQFVNVFCNPPETIRDDVRWPDFVQVVADRTSKFYKTHRQKIIDNREVGEATLEQLTGQKDQRPQFFRLRLGKAADLSNEFYIQNAWSGRQLDYPAIEGNPDGSHLQAYRYNGQTNQLWSFEEISPSVYRLLNNWSKKVMDNAIIEGNPDGSKVQGFKINDQTNQMWVLEQVGPDEFRFQNLYTRKYLENPNDGSDGKNDEVKLNAYTMNGFRSQIWTLKKR